MSKEKATERLKEKISELIPDETKWEHIHNFSDLIATANLNPKADFQYSDWSEIDFEKCDLRGFDFTGCRLLGCNFKDALIDGACFDLAVINGSNLRKAEDWVPLLLKSKPNPRKLSTSHLKKFSVFRDAIFTPEMVYIPPGEYMRGSPASKKFKHEHPEQSVTIDYPLAVSRFLITFNDWDFAIQRGGCEGHRPDDNGWGRGWNPVINVCWGQAQSYIQWLKKNTGERYRLLSEAEWEYCCRAGTSTNYYFGNIDRELGKHAWYGQNSNGRSHAVGQKKCNQFGLYDMLGNVWEWCEDHWHNSYHESPVNGKAWVNAGPDFNYPRVLRGGSWNSRMGENMRCASRSKVNAGYRYNGVGFRVARVIETA